jgi:hypothetical protein
MAPGELKAQVIVDVLHINTSQQARVLQLLRDRGESCPGCGSGELWTDGHLCLYSDGSADLTVWCPVDPHPYPGAEKDWSARLTSEELLLAGIRTGL